MKSVPKAKKQQRDDYYRLTQLDSSLVSSLVVSNSNNSPTSSFALERFMDSPLEEYPVSWDSIAGAASERPNQGQLSWDVTSRSRSAGRIQAQCQFPQLRYEFAPKQQLSLQSLPRSRASHISISAHFVQLALLVDMSGTDMKNTYTCLELCGCAASIQLVAVLP